MRYTYFDFHKECRGLRFDRVGVLIDGLHDELVEQGCAASLSTVSRYSLSRFLPGVRNGAPRTGPGADAPDLRTRRRYYYHDTTASGPQAQRRQTSVVRTNCMDWCVVPSRLFLASDSDSVPSLRP